MHRTTSIGLLLNLLLLFGPDQGLSPVTASDSDTDCVENGTRAHLTRCDKYFQCLLLPSQRIIWVSKQCEEGLIYDADHGKCVLPNLDWECNLGDDGALMDPDHPAPDHVKDQENVYGVDNFDDDYIGRSDESSGGEEVTDGSIEALEGNSLQSTSVEEEFSGDGTVATTEVDFISSGSTSTEAISMEMPITPDRDGTVKSYLQRLTQLIDGFRRNGASDTDITPDQLNSFVIMHKIKNGYSYRPTGTEMLPENGKILKPHLDYILQKQNSLNTVDSPPAEPPKPVRRRIIHIIRPYHRPEPQDHTNIVLKSHLGNGSDNQTELSNSQIVVNRPEGSVLFNIARPASGSEPARPQISSDPVEPSISEDTLKSVLELSKQLVSHQKYLVEKPNYLPPVVQPVYYSFPVPMIQSTSKIQSSPQGVGVNNSVVPQSINSLQSPPMRLQPLRYPSSQVSNKYNNEGYFLGSNYQNPQPEPFKQQDYSSASHEHGMNNNYVPLRPVSPYQGGMSSDYFGQNINQYNKPNSNYNQITSGNKKKYHNGHYSANQNGIYNSEGYYQTSQENSNNYHNSNQMMYSSHPPYYDGTGMGQSNSNNYNANYQNQQFNQMGQYSQYPTNYYQQNQMVPLYSSHNQHDSQHSHPTSSEELNDEFDSVESDDGNETEEASSSAEVNAKPVKKYSEEHSQEKKPSESPLSSLQLLSQQLMMDGSGEAGGNRNKIVGINGNYMSYDTYKETIMPLLNTDSQGESNLEVIACTAGIRHQNSSDCTRYYVCNPKTGNLLGYTCPPFTAFNQMTRICDANSYALCKPSLISTRFTIAENKRLQYEAQKALQDAKRIREQAVQAQKMAEFIRLKAEEEQAMKQTPEFMDTPAERPIRHRISQKVKRPSQQSNRVTVGASSAAAHRPSLLSSLGSKKRKRYKCLDVGQAIPDVENNDKYFMCFRDSAGRFKRRSMSCAKGLVFCRAKRMCSLKTRC